MLGVLVIKGKVQFSSIILTSFRQGVILPPPPTPQNEPLKSPPRLGLKETICGQRLTGIRQNFLHCQIM